MESQIDLENFSSGYLGKINTNLITKVNENVGGYCGDLQTSSFSTFEYEFDENGYVTHKVITNTECYSANTKEVNRNISHTYYEYRF